MTGAPLPDITVPLAAPFWKAAREQRLVMPRCQRCGNLCWPLKPVCPNCWRAVAESDWQEIADTGHIWSFAIYHRAFHPHFADQLPYNVAFIELDAGPLLISNIKGTNALAIGQRVKACYDPVTPQVTLVKFQLVQESREAQSHS